MKSFEIWSILEGVTLSWVQGVYQRPSPVSPGPWGAGGMFARSVWLGQEEHGSVRAGGEGVMSEFQKVKWLEQSDSATFAKFYIKAS